MRVALGQIACVHGDVSANKAAMLAAARSAREAGCAALLLPEMCDTGYPPAAIEPAAAQALAEKLREAARTQGLWILAGLSERDDGRLYNSLAVLPPDGTVLPRYRKLHLFRPPPACEEQRFVRGGVLRLCGMGGMLWGLSSATTCVSPLYRRYVLGGARVLANCAAWPRAREAHWQALLRARAIENQCFVLGVNHAGGGRSSGFCGRSTIFSPAGEILSEGADRGEALVVADLDPEEVERTRRTIPVFEDRPPGGYDTLPLETLPPGGAASVGGAADSLAAPQCEQCGSRACRTPWQDGQRSKSTLPQQGQV